MSGFIDLGRLGRADPYADLALLFATARETWDDAQAAVAEEAFAVRYGIALDRAGERFYLRLDPLTWGEGRPTVAHTTIALVGGVVRAAGAARPAPYAVARPVSAPAVGGGRCAPSGGPAPCPAPSSAPRRQATGDLAARRSASAARASGAPAWPRMPGKALMSTMSGAPSPASMTSTP